MIRVLVADNNDAVCKLVSDYVLLQQDMDLVGVAHDGLEALQFCLSHKPDVVILDLGMPKLDGIGVLEKTQLLPNRPHFVVLTGLSSESILRQVTELGAAYFMVKPFDFQLLMQRVRQVCNEEPEVEQDPVWVTELIQELGIPPHIRGYAYLREAVLLTLRDPSVLNGGVTTRLYPAVARIFTTSPAGVEASIRNAVLFAWKQGSEAIRALAAREGQVPSNLQLLRGLVERTTQKA